MPQVFAEQTQWSSSATPHTIFNFGKWWSIAFARCDCVPSEVSQKRMHLVKWVSLHA